VSQPLYPPNSSPGAAEDAAWATQRDTYQQGSQIGDSLDLQPVVSDMSKHTGSPDAGNFT
jgi:hypothetical protein